MVLSSFKSDHGVPLLCRALRMPEPIAEVRFHPTRLWRFDWAWPLMLLALEVDGGVWSGGRHTRGAGWLKDAEKLNNAAALGWRVFRSTPKPGDITAALQLVRAAIQDSPAVSGQEAR